MSYSSPNNNEEVRPAAIQDADKSSNISESAKNKIKRKRNRIPLSCTICRKRKVKCDKTHPHCNQCVKTGVQHLCHYMEQSWAEEVEKEISKDAELKQLRDRVKTLEETLAKVHLSSSYISPSTNTNTPDSITLSHNNSHLAILEENATNITNNDDDAIKNEDSPFSKYENDELDLTVQFDMLHLKNKGTVHLGATHWLAIMKGDPYLKLLWSQIFTMRERLGEWYNKKSLHQQKKKKGSLMKKSKSKKGKCPVDHKQIMSQSSKHVDMNNDINNINNGKIISTRPIRAPISPSDTTSNSASYLSNSQNRSTLMLPPALPNAEGSNLTHSQFSQLENNSQKCPVDHSKFKPIIQQRPNSPINSNKPGSPLPPLIQLPQTNPPFSDISYTMSNPQVMLRVCELLPPKSIISLYMDKFFKHIYAVIPIVDEQDFRKNINRILSLNTTTNFTPSTMSKENVSSLNITKISDYCNLGILLILMRLTWLSLPSNALKIDIGSKYNSFGIQAPSNISSIRIKEENLLFKYEPSIEALKLVRKNLIKFDELSSFSNNNVSLFTVQFAIFYKLYLQSGSDEAPGNNNSNSVNSIAGQDSETHQVLLSSITQMAFSCGLHRDPDNFPQLNSVADNSSGQSSNNNTTLDTLVQNSNHDPKGPTNSNASLTNDKNSTKTEQYNTTERFKHTWRKTWYYIISLDVQQSLSLGTPRLLRNIRDISDTKLPSASKIDYVPDIKELIIVKNFTLFFQIDLVIIAVLNHILNVSVAKRAKKSELDGLISSLKDLTHNKKSINEVLSTLIKKGLLYTSEGSVDANIDESYGLPSLETIIYQQQAKSKNNSSTSKSEQEKKIELPHESTTKAMLFFKHLTLRILLYLLNYILFTHYEPMGSENSTTRLLAKGYAQEALNYAMDGYKNSVYFFNSIKNSNTTESMFNYMEVMLTPYCVDVGNRSLQFMICLILRIKSSPSSSLGENPIINGKISTSDSTSSYTSSDNDEDAGAKFSRKRKLMQDTNDDISRHLDLESCEDLAGTLYSRMTLFYKMTKQISVKYTYVLKIFKSIQFFISLLQSPVSKNLISDNNAILMPGWQHPTIPNLPSKYKNSTQFIMNADASQVQRCPIYQDTISAISESKNNFNNDSNVMPGMMDNHSIQLPSIRSYTPITYNKSDVRNIEAINNSDLLKKRRTISNEPNSRISSPVLETSQQGTSSRNSPLAFQGGAFNEPLPSIEGLKRSVPSVTSMRNMGNTSPMNSIGSPNAMPYMTHVQPLSNQQPIHNNSIIGVNNTMNMNMSSGAMSPSMNIGMNLNVGLNMGMNLNMNMGNLNNIDPLSNQHNVAIKLEADNTIPSNNEDLSTLVSPQSEASSGSFVIPDFEEFLMQDSSFNNGLMIDASNLVEAVGFNPLESQDLVRMDSEIIPIDKLGMPGFQNMNGGGNFPVWN
ncbi:hypothetical protein TPHA_0B03630 [Tetrapisispora phaffii CBS 4417]|uniref:Zn(2)-C6 fungal-type domain-containing protein n=1 Tax=Tetrapisispora phaffii (strain ATCC 24235 / CBS 4417 / NBRC 1672 / NRRL Y-8282 / UCD 70-5) TaxID=1071381 RepID=G8BPV2_TETPH|nr:hypothetical protein TPHA_0B03630 [Tetrapisispora phaffii CBS 4417]CCE62033.1 hypothetical protein TPHA_0B03630 [Tetrapisispora phaffii CBS 4417]